MQARLIVRVTDAASRPMDASVGAIIGTEKAPRSPDRALPPAPGVYDFELPRYPTRLRLRVGKDGFYDFEQTFSFAPHPELPSLGFSGPEDVGVRALAYSSRGSDHNLEVHVVLSQLRDARNKVVEIALNPPLVKPAIPPLFFPPQKPQTIPLVEREGIVEPSPNVESGPRLIRFVEQECVAAGRVLFAERREVPKLVAMWVPDELPLADSAERDAIDFHVFFHSAIRFERPTDYPYRWRYLDQLHRYLFTEKRLVYQHTAARRSPILVFPLGSQEAGFGGLASPRQLHRLLEELCWWVPRMVRGRWPQKKVGRVAISGFGTGIDEVHRLLQARENPAERDPELEERICEIYDFDGVATSPRALVADLRHWLRYGRGTDRRLRLYHRDPFYGQALRDAVAGGVEYRRRFGEQSTTEIESEQATIVILPSAFWGRIDPRWAGGREPSLAPHLFTYHALVRSGFASL